MIKFEILKYIRCRKNLNYVGRLTHNSFKTTTKTNSCGLLLYSCPTNGLHIGLGWDWDHGAGPSLLLFVFNYMINLLGFNCLCNFR